MGLRDVLKSPGFRYLLKNKAPGKGSTSCRGLYWHGLGLMAKVKGRWIPPRLRGKRMSGSASDGVTATPDEA